MRHSFLLLSGCLALLALGACDRGAGDATLPAPAMPSPAATAAAGDSVSMRYACDGSHQVAVSGETARVSLADGSQLELSRAPDQQPPLFTGDGMEFSITEDGAMLDLDDSGRLACQDAG